MATGSAVIQEFFQQYEQSRNTKFWIEPKIPLFRHRGHDDRPGRESDFFTLCVSMSLTACTVRGDADACVTFSVMRVSFHDP